MSSAKTTSTDSPDFPQIDLGDFDFARKFDGLMQEGIRLSFTMGSILSVLKSLSRVAKESEFARVFGPLWNYFDAFGYYTGMHTKMNDKNYWGALCDFAMGTMEIALTTISFSQFGGAAFAACTWDACIRSMPKLITSLNQACDDYALMKDLLGKSEKAYQAILKIDTKTHKSETVRQRRKTLVTEYKRYAIQARALNSVLSQTAATLEQKNLCTKVSQHIDSSQSRFKEKSSAKLPIYTPEQNKKLAGELCLQAKQKAVENVFNTTGWLCAAVGMTLTTASALCPPLLVPGLLFGLFAATIKMSQLVVNTVVPKIKNSYQQYKEKQAFRQKQNLKIAKKIFGDIDDEQLSQFQVLYFYARDDLKAKAKNTDKFKDSNFEAAFYQDCIKPKWDDKKQRSKLKKIAAAAMKKYTQQRLLAKGFEVDSKSECFIADIEHMSAGLDGNQKTRMTTPSIVRNNPSTFFSDKKPKEQKAYHYARGLRVTG